MADSAPVTIRQVDGYEAQKGAVLELLYLTPSGSSGFDANAYAQLIATPGVAEANLLTTGGGTPTRHRRVSDRVWAATVVQAQGGLIGEIVPKTLTPDPDSSEPLAQWTLQSANLWRESSSWLRGAAVSTQDAGETVTATLARIPNPMDATSMLQAGRDMDAAAVAGARKAGSVATSIYGTVTHLLLFAVVVGGIAYVVSRRGLKIGKTQIL